ncbi:MAG: ribonuclease E/G [Pseudomonadota bacterium]
MKGRQIILGHQKRREIAVLLVNGRIEDCFVDPTEAKGPIPGAILRAKVGRPVKGQGSVFLETPLGTAFLRGAKGLGPGQMITVQVTALPEPGKAFPVTTRLLFKGRAAIITPHAPGINLSRSLSGDVERLRLHDAATTAMEGSEHGLIIRSAASELETDEIASEVTELRRVSKQVLAEVGDVPEILLAGPTSHELAWREWSKPVADAVTENADGHDNAEIIEQLAEAAAVRQNLGKYGAFAFIEPTRAMVAVDVNTGPDTSPAATLKANLAIAEHLPRLLRLRGLGGQIAIDLAPLSKRDRPKFESSLRQAFRQDPVETALVGWTGLGHFELQRKRERVPVLL